ncbi:MAG TPA: sulfite exporter TauE/SafE family protein, partial [Chromatiaceae bacterium]|nr:sulfite exporter TauE/SafE family protein [Chromatiaceae bacterium]
MAGWLLWYALTGTLAGMLAGLMGVGGGLVIVPSLLFAFTWQDVDPRYLAHLAVGSSLAAIIPISFSSLWSHQRRGAIRWPVVRRLTPGLMLGAWSG